jgi:4-hydroxy-3-polyprenylbenzoate decarboxylase
LRASCARRPVELVKCETVDLEVPAHAEIVLEGYVELGELRSEGPFGDHTGFYTMEDEYPVFHITCITHRKDPILCGDGCGQASDGRCVDDQGGRAYFSTADEADDSGDCGHQSARGGCGAQPDAGEHSQELRGQARKVMHAIWGAGAGDVYQMHRGGG